MYAVRLTRLTGRLNEIIEQYKPPLWPGFCATGAPSPQNQIQEAWACFKLDRRPPAAHFTLWLANALH
jgi:hypothetical protein